MTKKLVIVAALMTLCGGFVSAQEDGGTSSSGMTLNTNNKIKVSLLFGNSMMFNQNLNYVLPEYGTVSNPTTIGIGDKEYIYGDYSEDPGVYLNFSELGTNSLVNMAGIQFHYYLTDFLDVNAMFGMSIYSTPQKDFVEGINSGNMSVSADRYIEGKLVNNWMFNVGGNYHFATSTDKVDLYGGVQVGYQQGRIKTMTPYTGKDNLKDVIYIPEDRAGQVHCLTSALIVGVGYNFVPNFSIGFEVAPFAYQYSLLEVIPTGQAVYQAENHACKFLASPMLKLGIRF